jgi:hypothetical protein
VDEALRDSLGSLMSPAYKMTVTGFGCILFSEITKKDFHLTYWPSDILSKEGAI